MLTVKFIKQPAIVPMGPVGTEPFPFDKQTFLFPVREINYSFISFTSKAHYKELVEKMVADGYELRGEPDWVNLTPGENHLEALAVYMEVDGDPEKQLTHKRLLTVGFALYIMNEHGKSIDKAIPQ